MSEVKTPATPVETPKFKRERQLTRLVDAKGAVVIVVAESRKNGSFVSFSKHTVRNEDGKVNRGESKGRGTSAEHKTFDEAKAAANKVAEALKKIGWQLRAGGGGGGAQKDAFDLNSLPKPAAK